MRCVELFARELWTVGLYRLATAAEIERAAPGAVQLRELHTKLKVVLDTQNLVPMLRLITSLEEIERLWALAGQHWTDAPLPDPEPRWAMAVSPMASTSSRAVRSIGGTLGGLGGGRPRTAPRGESTAWRRMVAVLKRTPGGLDLDQMTEVLGIRYEHRGNARNRVVDLVKQAVLGGAEVELRGGKDGVRTVHLVGVEGGPACAGAGEQPAVPAAQAGGGR